MNGPNWIEKDCAPDLPENTIDLWLVDLNPAGYRFPDAGDCVFSADELERGARFHFDRHRLQYFVGRGHLRAILAAYTAILPEKIEFAYSEYEKPSLANPAAGLSFNLSNSHEMALIGVSRLAQIGVDLEYRDRHIWDADALARSVFTPQEVAELETYSASERLIPFLSGWTRKEAYLKGVGKGLALPLKDFSVELKSSEPMPQISAAGWQLASFWSAEDYLSAVAYPAGEARPTLRWFKWNGTV